jgi:hypothetical protein
VCASPAGPADQHRASQRAAFAPLRLALRIIVARPPLLLRRYVIICSSSAAFIPGRPRVLPQAVFGLISG